MIYTFLGFTCDQGWTTFGKSCYWFSEDSKDWNNAEFDCVSRGAHLASIHSDEEGAFLKRNYRLFFGLVQRTNGNFEWTDGSSFKYTNWDSNEPNNQGDEGCGELYENGEWNDLACARALRYVCKKTIKG